MEEMKASEYKICLLKLIMLFFVYVEKALFDNIFIFLFILFLTSKLHYLNVTTELIKFFPYFYTLKNQKKVKWQTNQIK